MEKNIIKIYIFKNYYNCKKCVFKKNGMFGHNQNLSSSEFFNRLKHTTTHTSSTVNSDLNVRCDVARNVLITESDISLK